MSSQREVSYKVALWLQTGARLLPETNQAECISCGSSKQTRQSLESPRQKSSFCTARNRQAQWPGVETGGILVGRISEAAQTVYVSDILPAPEDSSRSTSEFVLGTRGVRAKLDDFCTSCGYNLYCVGTWHNHLGPMGPSQTDHATATSIALARLTPSVLLVSTPGGYRALLATDAVPVKVQTHL